MEVQSIRAEASAYVSVFADDRGPMPHVFEDDSEAAWQEFNACCAALDSELRKLHGTLARAPARSHLRLRDIEARFGAELLRGTEMARDTDVAFGPEALRGAELLRGGERARSAGLTPDVGVDQVMALARCNDRICPNPASWRAMYRVLPTVRERGRLLRAPYPVELREWHRTTDLQKQYRLREQLEWAETHDALAKARDFLTGMRECDWHHSAPMAWPTL